MFAHMTWMGLESTLSTFGALFLIHSGGGLLSIGLWSLGLGPGIAIAYLAAAYVFPRWGTRPYIFVAVFLSLLTCLGLAFAGSAATSPLLIVSLSFLRSLSIGAYWSARNLLDYDLVPTPLRTAYVARAGQLTMISLIVTPLLSGLLIGLFPGGQTGGYIVLFGLLTLMGIGTLAIQWTGIPSIRIPPTQRSDWETLAKDPSWKWASHSAGVRGFSHMGGLSYLMPLAFAALLTDPVSVGTYQATANVVLAIGALATGVILSAAGVTRSLRLVWIPLTLGYAILAIGWNAPALYVCAVLVGLSTHWWNATFYVLTGRLIDADSRARHLRFVYMLWRELSVSLARLVASLLVILWAVLWPDGVRQLLIGFTIGVPVSVLLASHGWRHHKRNNLVPTSAPAPRTALPDYAAAAD